MTALSLSVSLLLVQSARLRPERDNRGAKEPDMRLIVMGQQAFGKDCLAKILDA